MFNIQFSLESHPYTLHWGKNQSLFLVGFCEFAFEDGVLKLGEGRSLTDVQEML